MGRACFCSLSHTSKTKPIDACPMYVWIVCIGCFTLGFELKIISIVINNNRTTGDVSRGLERLCWDADFSLYPCIGFHH